MVQFIRTRESLKSYYLESVQHAFEISEGMPYCWYRGHSRSFRNLTPSVFRPQICQQMPAGYESNLAIQFGCVQVQLVLIFQMILMLSDGFY
jgi:hypothetical protein